MYEKQYDPLFNKVDRSQIGSNALENINKSLHPAMNYLSILDLDQNHVWPSNGFKLERTL
jgi:hypothetical protein